MRTLASIRARRFFKCLILIPILIVLFLNIQLITQMRDFNTTLVIKKVDEIYFKNFQTLRNDNSQNSNKLKTITSSTKKMRNETYTNEDILNLLSSNSNLKITKSNEDILREMYENEILKLNENVNIKNRHFIASFLDKKNVLNLKTTKNTSQNIDNKFQINQKKYPSSTSNSQIYEAPKFLVILVQVHSRINYLKELIESLRNTKYIEETLLIFSHDVYNHEMNTLIANISFCSTLQIFYPYSMQLYKDKFPGQDPNDCPKSAKKEDALKSKCNNAAHPDTFGNYREAKVVQIKHHWFWKLSYVFEKLNETKNLENLHVLLLEEDYYLLPDTIHVLRKLTENDIDVVSLGFFDKQKQNLEMNSLMLYAKSIWHTTNHNTGLLLSLAQWKMIKDCLNAFCTYDDYNWDWTLQYLSQSCFKLPLVSIYPLSSRVVHIGECGTHHKGNNCDPKSIVDTLKSAHSQKQKQLFPENLKINGINTGIHKITRSNGGWSDPRDHQLCKSFLDSALNNANSSASITLVI